MTPAESITSRLEFCRQVGRGRWIARCPAHDDSSPSLSVREAEDGRVLIHCHAGCGSAAVISAIGMNFSDLYPESNNYSPLIRSREKNAYDDLLVGIAKARIESGAKLTESQKKEVMEAKLRIMQRGH